jgi:hypothetical protein
MNMSDIRDFQRSMRDIREVQCSILDELWELPSFISTGVRSKDKVLVIQLDRQSETLEMDKS